MRNQRLRLALTAVALYQGLAWLADFTGTLVGSLARGKAPAGILMQWTTGAKLPQALLAVALIAVAAIMNRRNGRSPEPETWHVAGGFLLIGAVFGFSSALLDLAGTLAQLRAVAGTHVWTSILSSLVAPLVENLLLLLFFLLVRMRGIRQRHDVTPSVRNVARQTEDAHILTGESIVLYYGITLFIRCASTPLMLLLLAVLRENASLPYGWISLGLEVAVTACLAVRQHRRRRRTLPPQPMQPLAFWISGTMLLIGTLRSLPAVILSLRAIMPPASLSLDASVLPLQQLSFVMNAVFALIGAGCAVALIALGERYARRGTFPAQPAPEE